MKISDGLQHSEKLAAQREAQDAYSRFLAPFLADSVRLQLISFGTEASFDPERFRLTAITEKANGWNVEFSILHSHLNFADDYIAEIENASDGKFLLRQVWYVDPFPEAGTTYLAYL
ncbi:hypothetical protein [Paracoccus aerodenitrificans]|uniref:hypothetical protein n=1 Tax=Paracoccus aerodenitrificans TaxID=3017781 RepID=UPI0022F05DD0|nr:hypothetical protein [Paracoccus aerodenitrificans]